MADSIAVLDSGTGCAAFVLPTPTELRQLIPLSTLLAEQVDTTRQTIGQVIAGHDGRLLVVLGPCSIHDRTSALTYARWLTEQQRLYSDQLLLVMRCYVEKPRTRHGWAGFVHDPSLEGQAGIAEGLVQSRQLMLDILSEGVPIATEFVEPAVVAFLGDLVSWSALGARTVESPVHRRLASGLPCPVGFKNGTSGSLQGAIDAMHAAQRGHDAFTIGDDGRLVEHHTAGLAHGHLILRGGASGRNLTADQVATARRTLRAQGLPDAVMVDCGHGNSDGTVQGVVANGEQLAQMLGDEPDALIGVMLESHLEAGRQSHTYGVHPSPSQSITDPCVGLEDTAILLAQWAATRR